MRCELFLFRYASSYLWNLVLKNLTLSLAIFDQHGNFYSLPISSLGKNGVILLKLDQYLSERCSTAYYSLCGCSNRRLCLALPCNNISVPKEKYDTQGEKKLDIIFSNASSFSNYLTDHHVRKPVYKLWEHCFLVPDPVAFSLTTPVLFNLS